MAKAKASWGIEVGANAIKALRLEADGDTLRVSDFETLTFKKILTDSDVDADEQIRVELGNLLATHDLSDVPVVASVPGHMAFTKFAPLPPVEPKKIPDIVRFEAVQQIPFPIEQVEWDYQTYQQEDSPDVSVGIFAIAKERLMPWLANFQAMGIELSALTLSPLAVFNALLYDLSLEDADKGTVLLDVGTQASDLIIVEKGQIWLRSIPLGGNHFTDALMRNFKLGQTKAEKLKREAASSKYARQIFQAMRPTFVDLVQQVQRSIGYYQSINRDAEFDKLIGLGSTFRLPGLQTFLKQQLQLDVERLDHFQKIEAEGKDAATFADQTLSFAPAYGLALQGLDKESVSCNLLPVPMIRQRVWRSKKKYFVAAAAAAVIGAGLLIVQPMLQARNYQANTTEPQVTQIINQAEAQYNAYRELTEQINPRGQIANIQRMLDYRDLWPNLISDVKMAMRSAILSENDPEQREALLSGNVEAILQIPREQRRLLLLSNLEAEYLPPAPQQTDTADGMPRTTTRQTDTVEPITEPGRFMIRVTGRTSIEEPNPETFINRTFSIWLRQNANRDDVPYTIDTETIDVRITGTLSADATERASIRRSPQPRRSTARLPGARLPGAQPQPAGTQPDAEEQEQAQRLIVDPFAAEEDATYRAFEITWEIELKDPAELRSIDAQNAQDAETAATEQEAVDHG